MNPLKIGFSGMVFPLDLKKGFKTRLQKLHFIRFVKYLYYILKLLARK